MKKYVQNYQSFCESNSPSKYKVTRKEGKLTLSTPSTIHITIYEISKDNLLNMQEFNNKIKDIRKKASEINKKGDIKITISNKNNYTEKYNENIGEAMNSKNIVNREFKKNKDFIESLDGKDFVRDSEDDKKISEMSMEYQKEIEPLFIHRTSSYSICMDILKTINRIYDELTLVLNNPNSFKNTSSFKYVI